MFYILSSGGKKSQSERAASVLKELRKCLRIATLGESEIDSAMALDWPDMEDAVVYMTAKAKKPMAIIARNREDFKSSDYPLLTCEELFEWLRTEHGIIYDEIDL